jgi:hypothetical protein
MSRTALKFPRRVRIHGGEFDESARAIHREDGVKTIQAESGIVLGSTIERKQMSTKTTFKRVALVAVAALGFGVMSVAPSSAAAGQADSLSAASATSTATVGTAVTNIVTSSFVAAASGDTSTMTVSLVSSPATSGALPTVTAAGGTLVGTSAASAASGLTVTVTSGAAGRTTGFGTVSLNPDVAGTYVVKITPHSGANATALTWTVTASVPNTTVSAAKTTAIMVAGEAATGTDVAVTASKALSDTATATIYITPKNSDDVALSALTAAITVPLTVTVTGPGTVAVKSTLGDITALTTGVGRAITGTTNHYVIGVFADGTAGVSTVTISSGTTVLATKTVTFYGAAATITPTVVQGILNYQTLATGAITAVVKDASGVVVAGQAVTATSGTVATIADSAIACSSTNSSGVTSCNLTGLAVGTSAITLTAGAATATTTSIRVSNGTATAVSYTFDKATYAPGETAKIKATVSNAAGLMPGGVTYTVTGGVTGNYSIGSSLVAGVAVPAGDTGSLEYTVVMPTGISGTVSLTGTAVTGVTATFGSADVVNEALDAALEAIDAATNAEIAATAAIEAAADAQAAAEDATAAAEDATAAAEAAGEAAVEAGEMAVAAAEAAGAIAQDALDAAIAATDAATDAIAAAEEAKASADEATAAATAAGAAVEALSTKVATLIAGLNAKVTTLSNLLAKIAKKLNVK